MTSNYEMLMKLDKKEIIKYLSCECCYFNKNDYCNFDDDGWEGCRQGVELWLNQEVEECTKMN